MKERSRAARLVRALAWAAGGRRRFVLGFACVGLEIAASSLLPLVVAWGVEASAVRREVGAAARAAGMAGVLVVVQGVATFGWVRSLGSLAHQRSAELRGRLVHHTNTLDLDFFTRTPAGVITTRMTSDIETLQQFVEMGFPMMLRASVLVVASTVVMFALSPLLTLVTLVCLVPLVIATSWYRKAAFSLQVTVRDRVSSLLAHVSESLAAAQVVQAFNLEEQRRDRFRAANVAQYEAKVRAGRATARYVPIVEALQPLVLAVVLALGVTLVGREELSVAVVVAFVLYLSRLFEPVQQFGELAHLAQAATAAAAKIDSFLEEQATVQEAPDAVPLQVRVGEVRLDSVTFRYGPSLPPAVRDIDITVRAGERVALVGRSGSGKSTLAKLVARFYDPTEGRVLVDGQDLRSVTTASLRRAVVLVPQEDYLFDGSVLDNIAIARPEASREDVERACRELGILDLFGRLPAGLDTTITGGGVGVSAAQRQLIGLARAFLTDPAVLVLDEATSHLDPATDLLVEGVLESLLAGRTAIIIAHKPATALRADRVVVLEHGVVAAHDAPADLQGVDGAFTRWLAAGTS